MGADLGPAMAARLVAAVKTRAPRTREEAVEAVVDSAIAAMSSKSRELLPSPRSGERAGEQSVGPILNAPAHRGEEEPKTPAVVLFYGINGAGKTTTIGKLAHRLKGEGRTPLIVAADTFRAAGIEQMAAWARRVGVDHFEGKSGADPASVVFDGINAARSRGKDVVLVDTAGRLQTQRNLLEELPRSDGSRPKPLTERLMSRCW